MTQAIRAARAPAVRHDPAPRRPTLASGDRPARPRHLRVVDPQARARAHRVRLAVWAFGAVSAVSVLVAVTFHVMLAQSEFELARITERTAIAQQRYQQQRLEVAELGAPGRIVARATELGMVAAGGTRYVTPPAGSGSASPEASAAGTSAALGDDWGKVKEHLAAQP